VALTLDAAIPPGKRILIDTSVALAYLTGTESTSPAATRLFDDFLASGRDVGAMSMITVGEILVRPFRVGPSAAATVDGFLQHFAELDLIEIDYAIAREAARVRASTNLRMPDALILSSATVTSCDLLCTNDRSLAAAAGGLGIGVCLLSEVTAS
jgi:predicted nucleic acid-binding protein